jgi:hypothetical protein
VGTYLLADVHVIKMPILTTNTHCKLLRNIPFSCIFLENESVLNFICCRPVGVRTYLESVVCSGFEESIFDCQHVLGGDNCSFSVGIECSKATGYVVITLQCVCVCVCVCECVSVMCE